LDMLLQQFLEMLKAKNRGERTIISLKEALVRAETFLGKPLEDATIEDLSKYMAHLRSNGSNTNSLSLRGSQILQFLKFCLKQTDDEKYNRLFRKFKDMVAEREKPTINPQDLYTPEDVKKVINVATLERDRCIIACLYEGGFRISELLSLRIGMIEMNAASQEVTFHIPNMRGKGTKTGARSVVCLEVYGYVQDWLKCHPDPKPTAKFINISKSGVDKQNRSLFKKAGINKPANLHNYRHSAITNACIIKMQPYDISMRFWGIPNSSMLSVYVHLSEQVQADAYREAKGMGNGNSTTVINPLASRCAECGKLIQSGNLCKQCSDIQKLKEENAKLLNAEMENSEMRDALHALEQRDEERKREMDSQLNYMKKLIAAMPKEIVAKVDQEVNS